MSIDTTPSHSSNRRATGKVADCIFLVGLILTAFAVFIPFSPNMPSEGLDPSWMFAMNQAVAQGLVFGKDIVFTFGPYASVYTKVYHPATDHLMLWGSAYLAVSFIFAAFLNFRHSNWLAQFALLAAFSTIVYSPDVVLFFYALLAGTYLYRSIVSNAMIGAGNTKDKLILVALFAPFGLLPLIKGSALIACVAIVIFSIFLLLKAGQRALAIVAGVTPLLVMVAFWSIAKQPLSALPQYFKAMLPIISGYTEAMAITGDPSQLSAFVLSAAVLACIVFAEQDVRLHLKSTVTLMFLCILFLSFKAGFVRHDAHAVISGTMILLVALLASTLVSPRQGARLLLVCTAAWVVIDAGHIKTSTETLFQNFNATYVKAWNGAKMRLTKPDQLQADFNSRLAELKTKAGFPALPGTVDVYSYDQSYLISSDNRWNSRPILQSYSVYTPALVERNKNHLLGASRPDNILFQIQPIDGRLPSLEEGASWPVLLSDYSPASSVKGYLLLKHRPAGANAAIRSEENFKRSFALGERIELPKNGKVLYAKVGLKKSLLGSIANTLLKPSQLEIKLALANGGVKTFRMVAGMAETGFVISPLIENTEDFGLLYAGTSFLMDKEVASFTIAPLNHKSLWRNNYEVQLTSLEYPANPNVAGLYGLAQPVGESALGNAKLADKCDGSIDAINGVSPAPADVKLSGLLDANGWLAPAATTANLADKIYLVLSNEQGKRYFIETRQTERPDVGAFFKQPQMKMAGFAIKADVSKVPANSVLGLAYSKNGSLFLCPQFKVKTEFMHH